MPILEDDCYVDLRFEGETQPAFRALDDSGIVIHVASYSKLVAPGLRLGYFTAQGDVMRRAANFRVGGGPSQFASYAVEGFLRDNLDDHRARFNPVLKEKRDAMIGSLEANFAGTGATWSHPQGGCYVWLTMPDGTDLEAVQPACMEGGVGFVPGPAFAPNNDGAPMRPTLLCVRDSRKKPQGNRPPRGTIRRTRSNVASPRQLNRR